MVWVLFLFGCILTFDGIVSSYKGLLAAVFQFLVLLIGLSTMFGAMYLRHLGW